MEKYEALGQAIYIATTAHAGQYDRGGKPYILHPLHIMTTLLFDVELAIIGVMHDVVEDSNVTLEDLTLEGFSPRVINALGLLTHRLSTPYGEYIEGICGNYDAVRVKRKDLEHNSDITRLKGATEKDLARTKKYHKAFTRLTEAKRTFEA